MTLYKKGQGNASRMGAFALIVLVGAFAGYSWFGWCDVALSRTGSMGAFAPILGMVGAVALFLLTAFLAMWVSFLNPRTAEYLLEMDLELRKVVWPSVKPPFDPKAEAWGSTYVVIVLTILLTVYLGLIDSFLEFTMARHLLVWLLT